MDSTSRSQKCCLCSREEKDRRRLRRLHGDSSVALKQHLQSLSAVSLDSLQETSDKDAKLCSTCESEIREMKNLEAKITGLQEKVQLKISKLRPAPGKRQHPAPQPPAQKHIWLLQQVSNLHAHAVTFKHYLLFKLVVSMPIGTAQRAPRRLQV